MKKQVFHINEKVVVKNPLFFVRCGYPLNKEYAKKNLFSIRDNALIDELVGRDPVSARYKETAVEKIKDAIAYVRLIENDFGGPERKIFTKEVPELLGKEAVIFNKKYVKTGIRHDGFQSGENEWQPTTLSNEKTHILLLLGLPVFYEEEMFTSKSDSLWDQSYWIEEIHLLGGRKPLRL